MGRSLDPLGCGPMGRFAQTCFSFVSLLFASSVVRIAVVASDVCLRRKMMLSSSFLFSSESSTPVSRSREFCSCSESSFDAIELL